MADQMIADPVLEIQGLEHHLYDRERDEEFVVYVDQPLKIARGSMVALLGPSGCGKTTLLTILGLLRGPSHPHKLDHFKIHTLATNGQRTTIDLKNVWVNRQHSVVERLRREHVGFTLQSGELLPALTVRENIAMPLWLNGVGNREVHFRVDELLNAFQLMRPGKEGVAVLDSSRINRLSGGEYQRVALARAIAHRPTLVFVDEPTAALNRELAWDALSQLRAVQSGIQAHGATIMITHDEELAGAFADMIVRMMPIRGRPAGIVSDITIKNRARDEFQINMDVER